MNAAHLKRVADLHRMLSDVQRAKSYNRTSLGTTVSVAGASPFNLDAGAAGYMLTALRAYLIDELTRLGVTELENV